MRLSCRSVSASTYAMVSEALLVRTLSPRGLRGLHGAALGLLCGLRAGLGWGPNPGLWVNECVPEAPEPPGAPAGISREPEAAAEKEPAGALGAGSRVSCTAGAEVACPAELCGETLVCSVPRVVSRSSEVPCFTQLLRIWACVAAAAVCRGRQRAPNPVSVSCRKTRAHPLHKGPAAWQCRQMRGSPDDISTHNH